MTVDVYLCSRCCIHRAGYEAQSDGCTLDRVLQNSGGRDPIIHYLFIGLEWNRVHYYCGHLLACFTSCGR
jgi:hypothetical protein